MLNKFFLVTLIILLVNLPTYQSDALAKFTEEDIPSVTVPVTVSLHISSITEIDSVNESWSMAGYMLYEWSDPKLQKNGVIELDKIWHPGIEIVNFIETNLVDATATVKKGRVYVQERFTAKLSAAMKFTNFPFDKQGLEIDIESIKDPGVVFIPYRLTVANDDFTALSEWRITGTETSKAESYFPPEHIKYSRGIFTLKVERNSQFFVNKIIIPIGLLTLASFSVFFVKHTEFGAATGISLTTALTSLTLWLLSSDGIPKTSISSILDNFIYTSLLINFLAFAFVIAMHHRLEQKFKTPRWIRKMLKVCFPIAYVVISAIVLRN